MALTIEGYTAKPYADVLADLVARKLLVNPDFDTDPSSVDMQELDIFAYEIAQVYNMQAQIFNSYDPSVATGMALRNVGLITGFEYVTASRTQLTFTPQGIDDTPIPLGSLVTSDNGDDFYTTLASSVGTPTHVAAVITGTTPIPLTLEPKTVIAGWDTCDTLTDSHRGDKAQNDQQYRNQRTKTVLKNHKGIVESIHGTLTDAGVGQVAVINNDTNAAVGGVPANTIHVIVGEVVAKTDLEIAQIIYDTKGEGTPTHGSTSVDITDSQGSIHAVNFTKSSGLNIFIDLDVTFLAENSSGAEGQIRTSLIEYVTNLEAGEDVIWSHMFGIITQHAAAQINSLEIGLSLGTLASANVIVSELEFAVTEAGNIGITVTP